MSEILYQSQRIVATNTEEKIKINSPADIEKLQQIQDIKDQVQEHLLVITLNNKNFVSSIELVAKGSKTCVQADVSDIVRCAILRGSTSIIVVHNHPTGDSTPSKHDLYFTKRLNTISSYLNIKLLDHIIVGDRIFSMQKENLIDIDSDFKKLENSVIDELRKENADLHSKIERKESISEKARKAKEKSKMQISNGRGRDHLNNEMDGSTL